MGLPASGLVDAAPDGARAAAVIAGVLALPAVVFLPLAGRAVSGAAAVPALALFLWLSALALWTECFARLGASFTAYAGASAWALLAVCGMVAVRGTRLRSARRAPRVARIVLVLSALVALVAVARVCAPTLTAGEDGPDHVGHIRRIMAFDAMRPDGILAWPEDASIAVPPDPRKGAFHAVLALLASLSGCDPAVAWRYVPAFMFPAAVLAFLVYNAAFVAGGAARALAAALFLLSYGGNLWQFAPATAYGQNLAAAWGWVLVPLALAIGRAGWTAPRAAALVILVAGGVFVHLGVFLHAAVLAAGLALAGGWLGMNARLRLSVAAGLLLVASLPLALRRAGLDTGMNIIHGHTQGVLFWTDRLFSASPMEILRQHGMLFLGGLAILPVTLLASRARADARAVLAVSVVPLVISFTPLAVPLYERGSYMVFRALLGIPVFAATAVTLSWMVVSARRRGTVIRAIAAVALVAWVMVFLRPALGALGTDTRGVLEGRRPAEPVSTALVAAVAALPAGSTILSDPATAYVLSAATTHRFVALHQQHANPGDAYALDRLRTVRDVLSPFALPEAAVEACRRYRVDYVVLNGAVTGTTPDFLGVWDARGYAAAHARLASMTSSFAPVDSVDGGLVFRFEPGAAASRTWPGLSAPVGIESPPLLACEIEAPDGVFRVTGIDVHPRTVLPGDTVTVTLGYSRETPAPFGLPMLIHLRFDHESIPQVRRYPGEKYVRRAAERRAHSYVRFRADVPPGRGVYEPDLWPIGAPLCERVRVVVPRHARLGTYRVEVNVVRDSLLPNFHVSDLLYDRDHYSGRACASLRVADRVTEDGP